MEWYSAKSTSSKLPRNFNYELSIRVLGKFKDGSIRDVYLDYRRGWFDSSKGVLKRDEMPIEWAYKEYELDKSTVSLIL